MIGRKWWEQFPERLAYELDALAKAGIAYTRDEEAFACGVYRLHVEVPLDGERIPLVVTFPDLYPYFRFEVDAPTLLLDHHQNPFVKNLCLIGRGTHNWHMTRDTVGGLLQQQLSVVVETGGTADRDTARGLEEEQAEPFSTYYPYPTASIVVMQGPPSVAGHRDGTFVVATMGPAGALPDPIVRGGLVELRVRDGTPLFKADDAFGSAFPGRRLKGMWIRLDDPIQCGEPGPFLEELLSRFPTARQAPIGRVEGGWIQFWGVAFPDESGWRNREALGWVFLVLFNQKRRDLVGANKRQWPAKEQGKNNRGKRKNHKSR